jgi:hypothetical protein
MPSMQPNHVPLVVRTLRKLRTSFYPLKRILARLGLHYPQDNASTEDFQSASYWEQRYATGGNSGAGSYNELARYKADVINRFVGENRIETAIEFGAGDGAQLALLDIPHYIGLDVSPTALRKLKQMYADDATKEFRLYEPGIVARANLRAAVTLSLDVIYHLVEDSVFEQYMDDLFSAAERFVIVYASNTNERDTAQHVRHRRFTDYVDAHFPQWKLDRMIENPHKPKSFADFYFYVRSEDR